MKLTAEIPNKVTISFSGGVDSVFAVMFCLAGNRTVKLIHFNHQTSNANTYEYFCRMFAITNNLPLDIYRVSGKNECEWRDQRYEILSSQSYQVITGHHKDDNEETLLMRKRPIPSVNGNIIRPFLNFPKSYILDKAKRENWDWVEDLSNQCNFTARNVIRNKIIPQMKKIGVSV